MNMKLKYKIDENGEEILVDRRGFQVMMTWEKTYMEALIDHLNPAGDVLEIGFGMAYSANQIQKYPIKSHTIIEADETVLEKLNSWAKEQPHTVNIIHGTWQKMLPTLGKFDSVFFDDSPYEGEIEDGRERLSLFFQYMLTKHANVNARMTWYNVVPPYFRAHPATEFSCKTFNIDIPDNCQYVPDRMKQAKTVFMPLLKYPLGSLTKEQILLYNPIVPLEN